MTSIIDLRSDTVTRPSAAMRTAMANAEVGDDVYLEDPTVNKLQDKVAELFQFEASLFVPTGTMGNQICVKMHTNHGQEIILEKRAHIYRWEVGMTTAFAGVLPRIISTDNGHPTWEQIAQVIQPKTYYCAQTALICLENSHNMAGGTVLSKALFQQICTEAHKAELKVHLDGARIFNAAIATGESLIDLTSGADTVMFCLSKGLGAPAGSMILGSSEAIEKARVLRKMMGGGMRQVGILAAAGLVALDESPKYILEDHHNAKILAQELANISGVKLDPSLIQTNIVIIDISETGLMSVKICEDLAQLNVLAGAISKTQIRFVTHRDVTLENCKTAVAALKKVV